MKTKKYKNRLIFALVVPLLLILFCLSGILFAPNNPYEVDIANKFQEPSSVYPFGTDELGRCELSRILYGGTSTIGIIILGLLLVGIFGVIIGLLISQLGEKNNVLMDSLLNAVTAIPPITYLIIFIGVWGNSIPTMTIALTASLLLRMIKLVKTQAEIEYKKAYIKCMISCGAGRYKILFKHILPNLFKSIVHFLCLSSAEMVMVISGFSFIGLNLGDNVIDWGSMLSQAREVFWIRPSLLLYPSLFIFLSCLSFNILAKSLGGR